MLLTIRAELSGGDLGYLLHKNPARVHSFELSCGKAYVFYPELGDHRAQAALLLDIDPVSLVRGTGRAGAEGLLDQYVNDRPYAASSFLSVALSRVFGTAMSGRGKERQDLADQPLEFETAIAAVPSRGGEALLRSLFEPGCVVLRGRVSDPAAALSGPPNKAPGSAGGYLPIRAFPWRTGLQPAPE
ncbi:MAG: hypothetical protein HYZ57_19830 [Acidobacteria bacterium]|nr:hypothetical protein [Acidobacteriota bacterium]